MNIKKYIGIAFISVISFSSCKKFLDIEPVTQISEDVALTSKERIQRALTGAYSRLQVIEYYGAEWPNAVWLSGDNVMPFSAGTTDLQFYGHAVLSSSNTMEITWRAMYQAINAANNVIDAIQKVDDPTLTDSARKNMLGQAQFIRALVYFDMVRTWGGVPLVLSPTRGLTSESYPARNTVAEVYTQVIADLTSAEANLPAVVSRTIATKRAAQALRARVALYRGDWATAEQKATEVINATTEFSLVAPFEKVITDKRNSEGIFELEYSQVDGNELSAYFYPTSMGGYYRVGPTPGLIALLSNPAVAGNRNVLLGQSGTAYYGNRFRRANGATKDDNYAILRLAEMYLIRAEARANTNKINEGKADLDIVRARAGLPPAVATTQAQLLQAIEDERRIEFAFEPHRWFDLIRTNRAAAVLGVTDTRKYLFPIPGTEVLTNTQLIQNDGY